MYQDPARHIQFESEKKGSSLTGSQLNAHCEAWREWCISRKYFVAPGKKNVLARMQPSKGGGEAPDAILSDELSFFNMAVHALADMGHDGAECFIKFYWFRLKNIKSVAAKMNISRDTFYERKRRFAERAYSMGQSLKSAHMAALAMPVDRTEID